MSLSRWLNTASRFLRLWVSTPNPSSKLKTVVYYIMKVYLPIWFEIKKYNYCTDGPKHMCLLIKLTRYLPEELKKIVDKTIQNYGFFLHPENILLSMLVDERKDIRKIAVNKILSLRESGNDLSIIRNNEGVKIRTFKVSSLKINFDAEEYTELVNMNDFKTEPPLIKDLNNIEVIAFIENHDVNNPIFKFPCHTQAVERCVKEVSNKSLHMINDQSRQESIQVTLENRKKTPKYDTKNQYKVR